MASRITFKQLPPRTLHRFFRKDEGTTKSAQEILNCSLKPLKLG